jgi:hypothetical protein
MTALSEGLKCSWLDTQKTRKIEKVTGSQDDGFVGGLAIQLTWICRKHEKIEKVTGSQDDDFVGGLQYSWLDVQEARKI